jgi:hypothetical protein
VPDNLLYGCTPIEPSAGAAIKHDKTAGGFFRLKAEAPQNSSGPSEAGTQPGHLP